VRQQLGAGQKSLLSAHDARDVQRRASPSEAKDPSGQPANAHARPCRRRPRARTARRRHPQLHHRSRSPLRKPHAPLRKGVRVRGAALEDGAATSPPTKSAAPGPPQRRRGDDPTFARRFCAQPVAAIIRLCRSLGVAMGCASDVGHAFCRFAPVCDWVAMRRVALARACTYDFAC
jgi:hypothetical protein